MPAVLERLEHQHGVRLAVAAQAGQVGERAVRAEDVVRVVAAHLQATGGHDEPLAREGLADPRAALRGIPRSIGARRRAGAPRRPALGHKSAELVGGRPRAVVCLLLLFAAHRAHGCTTGMPRGSRHGAAPTDAAAGDTQGDTRGARTCGEATSSTRVRILRTRVDDPPEHSLPPGPVDRSGGGDGSPGESSGDAVSRAAGWAHRRGEPAVPPAPGLRRDRRSPARRSAVRRAGRPQRHGAADPGPGAQRTDCRLPGRVPGDLAPGHGARPGRPRGQGPGVAHAGPFRRPGEGRQADGRGGGTRPSRSATPSRARSTSCPTTSSPDGSRHWSETSRSWRRSAPSHTRGNGGDGAV